MESQIERVIRSIKASAEQKLKSFLFGKKRGRATHWTHCGVVWDDASICINNSYAECKMEASSVENEEGLALKLLDEQKKRTSPRRRFKTLSPRQVTCNGSFVGFYRRLCGVEAGAHIPTHTSSRVSIKHTAPSQ